MERNGGELKSITFRNPVNSVDGEETGSKLNDDGDSKRLNVAIMFMICIIYVSKRSDSVFRSRQKITKKLIN